MLSRCVVSIFFFFNDTATTEIYTLSLHDALPIWRGSAERDSGCLPLGRYYCRLRSRSAGILPVVRRHRSEEHTSELQSPDHLVCRLLLEKKKRDNEHTCVPQDASICDAEQSLDRH